MSLELMAAGFLMGLAGTGHCAVMCGAACAALARSPAAERPLERSLEGAPFGAGSGWVLKGAGVISLSSNPGAATPRVLPAVLTGAGAPLWAFLASRAFSYALGGAVVAASVSALAGLGQAFSALRPFWILLQVAFLVLGLWLLVAGRQPRLLLAVSEGLTRRPDPAGVVRGHAPAAAPRGGPVTRAALAGAAWVFLPCGLLQSALVTAALASTPWGGAGVMIAFAASSSLGLLGAPALAGLLRRFGPAGERLVTRVAGALVAGAAAGALWMMSTTGLARALCIT